MRRFIFCYVFDTLQYMYPLTVRSKTVEFFWAALTQFTPADRRRFVQFAYAQESLPSTDDEFDAHPRMYEEIIVACTTTVFESFI